MIYDVCSHIEVCDVKLCSIFDVKLILNSIDSATSCDVSCLFAISGNLFGYFRELIPRLQ